MKNLNKVDFKYSHQEAFSIYLSKNGFIPLSIWAVLKTLKKSCLAKKSLTVPLIGKKKSDIVYGHVFKV